MDETVAPSPWQEDVLYFGKEENSFPDESVSEMCSEGVDQLVVDDSNSVFT